MSMAFVLESRNKPSMSVQVHAASRALNDCLEESRTLLESYLMPLGALQVDIFG